MTTSHRNAALQTTMNRTVTQPTISSPKLSSIFGTNVFGKTAMREFLPEEAYDSVMEAMEHGTKIDRKIADQVASAMRSWAAEKGATHYTHWFQPLTGATAEKHDSFFHPTFDGGAMDRFDGAQLVQQEPDASSFPNGGIRNTFEARGYTAWDPTSPAFVIGTTLCIPTIFVSYTGEALDHKTPLLRALQTIDKAATDVCQYFDKKVNKVNPTLGWEQEYFLVDIALFQARPDLVQCGRTLFGHAPAKGQQLDDHYFGSIPERAMNYMRDLEQECLALGIPIRTRHNEVAPNQFELAPMFEEVNIAVDHNSLLMDVMDKLGRKHNLAVLSHEKPFKGVNGSGKHNNWSLGTNTGKNLLSPGKTPKSNLQFLTFFINTIKAVHDYADLMRASIASSSNEHRLGANEAPPAIMSVFIGSQLTAVLDELEKVTEGNMSPQEKTDLKLNVVGKIPEILLDNTDRNRTSPFAFTGNKFEFRAVGSLSNCAGPMTVLNAIVAKQLIEFKAEVDALIKGGLKKDEAIFNVLREYIKASKKIRFEGDGYGDAWVEEALGRGLKNEKSSPAAMAEYISEQTLSLFEEMKVMNRVEVEARYEIMLEEYTMNNQIESRLLGDMATSYIIPTAVRYQNTLIENVRGLKEVLPAKEFSVVAKEQLAMISEISAHISAIKSNVDAMIEDRKKANNLNDSEKTACMYHDVIKAHFDEIRYHADKLELMVDNDIWPLPKYREMLFTR